MIKAKELPPQQYLKECFDYEPDIGLLTWKHRPPNHFKNNQGAISFNSRFAGKQVSYVSNVGYISMSINDRIYYAHRVIWKMVTGFDPVNQIDHKDGCKTNNAIDNLREATSNQNNRNIRTLSTNTSGFKGVCFIKARNNYVSYITVNGKRKHLGCFKTAELAYAKYCMAAKEYHGEFARLV